MYSYDSMVGKIFKLTFSHNVKKYKSDSYKFYPNSKRHYYSMSKLMENFPDNYIYVSISTYKGIGKSYSIWNEKLIPKINKGQIVLNIRWTEDELEAMVEGFKDNPDTLQNKINFATHWKKQKKLYILMNSETNEPVIYFTAPSGFKSIKGLPSKESHKLKEGAWFWDEFLLSASGDYRQPQHKIDSLWQAVGSLFRDKEWIGFMSANIVNPDNPFIEYMFKDIGWPQPNQTIVDHTRKIVLDSPYYHEDIKKDYENNPLFVVTQGTAVHRQLFGGSNLNESIYDNLDHIIYRYEDKVEFVDNFRLGMSNYTFLSIEDGQLMYVTDQNLNIEIRWAGDKLTALQTNLELIDDSFLWHVSYLLSIGKVRFNSVRTMNSIIKLIGLLRWETTVIDWSKKEK